MKFRRNARSGRAALWAAVLSFAVCASAANADETIAFIGARLIRVDSPELPTGVLIVRDGRILAVGAAADTNVPPDARRIDVTGKVIMPGIVDTHNHIGGIGGGDQSKPLHPDVRIYDSLNPRDAGFRRAVAGGLTTLNIMPGSGHLLSGQTVYVKLRPAHTIEEMAVRNADGLIAGGIKMANGTNSRGGAPFPGTRAKSAALVREMFIRAVEYQSKVTAAGDDASKKPDRDLGLEALGEVLSGKRVVHHHTHRADDIVTVLRLSKEFGFRVVLHHVSEAWMVADEIAAAGARCSVILVDSPGGKLEASQLSYETAAILDRAGVNVAFHTDDWITDSRLFLRMAALGVRGGLPREKALRALTLSGAEMLDLQDRVGSLTVGKDADFVVLDGDPLSVYSKVLETWVEGRRVFDRNDPQDRLYGVGGYGAGFDTVPYMCCHGDGE
ncbi:MAG: amidohydrolase family protein [Phycisphaerales bacterium]|nr:amidohydrolase family protein [Phycisphaerales bacterium]